VSTSRSRAHCNQCGEKLPSGAAYCPNCGLAVDSEGALRRVVNVTRLEPRFFGVPSPEAVLAAALVALALAAALLTSGHWLAGPFFLVICVLVLVVFSSLRRRFPDTPVVRWSRDAIAGVRRRTTIAVEVGTARLSSRLRAIGLTAALNRLSTVRRERALELGEAAYAGDTERAEAARERVAEIETLMEEKRAEVAAIEKAASERARRARREARPTDLVVSKSLRRGRTARQAH
jgi:hypothetical protein